MDLDQHAAGVIADYLEENYAEFLAFAEEHGLEEIGADQGIDDLKKHAGRE